MAQVWGTVGGRWYVTAFGAVFVWCAIRHLGWRRTALYAAVAFAVGALAENLSVHVGFPYTKYSFNPSFRGGELYVGEVPLFVPLSYTFSAYFAWAAARMVVSGPWRTRGARRWQEWTVAVLFAVWPVWVIDPASRIGGFYLGRVFSYDGSGFWFGLPLLSQVGYACVNAVVISVLVAMARDERDRPVPGGLLRHPHLVALITWHAQWVQTAVAVLVVGQRALGGSAFLMYIPAALITAVLWSHLRPVAGDQPPRGERVPVDAGVVVHVQSH